jgi:hypothetical protein
MKACVAHRHILRQRQKRNTATNSEHSKKRKRNKPSDGWIKPCSRGCTSALAGKPEEQRPQLVRGDCAFGNEVGMRQFEEIEQPYLFELKQTSHVKQPIERQSRRCAWCVMLGKAGGL